MNKVLNRNQKDEAIGFAAFTECLKETEEKK